MIRDNLYLDPNCKLYLPLRDLDGDNITDRSAHGLAGTNNGTVYGMQGRDFDGVDQFIDYGDAEHMKITDQITVLVWLNSRIAVVKLGFVCCKSAAFDVAVYFNNPTLCDFRLTDSGGGARTVGVDSNFSRWRFLAGTYNGKTQRLYLDGQLVNTADWVDTLQVDDNRLLVGARVTGGATQNSFMEGKIGEIAIYNRALTQVEIERIYQVTKEDYQ